MTTESQVAANRRNAMCSTGPMTGRFIPPIGGVLHFLRPGTTKLSLFPGLPVIGGTRRTRLDVALYAASFALLFRALLAPEITASGENAMPRPLASSHSARVRAGESSGPAPARCVRSSPCPPPAGLG